MLNKVMLIGRLVRDVELRTTSSGKSVANASLVTSKKFKNKYTDEFEEKAEFHNLVIWLGAENFAKYLSKGSKVYVEGELFTEMYEKDGVKKYTTKINVNNFVFLDSKTDNQKTEETVVKKDGKIEVEELPIIEQESIDVSNILF